MAENIDLAKTFAAIGGTTIARPTGTACSALLHGDAPAGWRNAVLVEHHGGRMSVLDPDFQRPASGNPTTYEAMRTHDFLYVEYDDGEREFYDLRRDPFELAQPRRRTQRRRSSHGFTPSCSRSSAATAATACWAAMHVAPGI